MKKRYLFSGLALVVVLGALVWFASQPSLGPDQLRVTLSEGTVVADVVDTESERERGLSGRATLSDTEGMLFVFPKDSTYAFWMKDMLIPIDMIWLSSDKKVVYLVRNATPESYPASFVPDMPARFVLEVPSGWADQHNVNIGSEASWK